MSDFTAGVTFSSWKKEHVIVTGSYDQHIRLFDMRKSKEPLKVNEVSLPTSGGVWHIEDCHHSGKQCHIAACMYGGWTLLDEGFDTIQADEKAGQELLYGVTMASENLLVYTTFNDYKVTAVTV
ncbi:hypothetical protein Y032_0008g254 [Ancylostoma ceylanicum]|uniref:WD domain, G-beta repeat protein n=1 Tax=Ancylostoma ceylanicum TaxID=53326 RepID=A0A016VKG2_9BILA|nr:hypothetical protein Y032_0008g254 [Ancylostoma ceylanicum]